MSPSDPPMMALLQAGRRVRRGFPNWLRGAPTHVLAELLTELEKDGWELKRRTPGEWKPGEPQTLGDRISAEAASGWTGEFGEKPEAERPDPRKVALAVASYWRDEALQMTDSPLRGMSHPLALVIAALNGETDPRELGTPWEELSARMLRIERGEITE